MTKHTPAPWNVIRFVGHATYEVCVGGYRSNNAVINPIMIATNIEHKANANLIAAAPELLAALENLHGACEYWEDQNDPVLANARAVITKAKGN